MGITRIILTARLKKSLEGRGMDLTCHRFECDDKIEPGDRIVIRCTGMSGSRYYHEKCYDEMFYEPPRFGQITRFFKRRVIRRIVGEQRETI